jgi:SAM-dependent methyltransferase/uncharacterized protein YbaR (Trm112 family)
MSHSQASSPSNNNSNIPYDQIVDGFETASEGNRYYIRLTKINKTVADHILRELANLRKTGKNIIVFEFDNVEVESWGDTVPEKMKWSRMGQVLRNYIHQAHPFTISVLRGKNHGEAFELALATNKTYALPGAEFGFKDFPMWGNLYRLTSPHVPVEDYFKPNATLPFDIETLIDENVLEEIIASYETVRSSWYPLVDSIPMIIAEEESDIDVTETVIYANKDFFKDFTAIEYLGEGDFSERFFDISDYKDLLVRSETNRIEHGRYARGYRKDPVKRAEETLIKHERAVKKLFSQDKFPIKGRCIELGSEAGYFSMLLSKQEAVTEVMACEVNKSTIFWSTPALAEKIQPDWNKLRYLICDYDEVKGHGTFDVVVFCCSLNCSPDENVSLKKAYDLLKPGGILILHDEHIYHHIFNPKIKRLRKNNARNFPLTTQDFFERLRMTGFEPHVFHNVIPGSRFPRFKKFVLEVSPLKHLNGWALYAQHNVIGVKPEK